jgi:hypothetical protein
MTWPRLTIEQMQIYAKEKEGKCLSNKYTNAKTKLTWKCKQGHIWKTNADCIKQGTWCPYCANTIKKTIKEMRDIARSKNGKCLSKKYINDYSNLIWKCKNKHVWKATHSNIGRGTWCPTCAGLSKLSIKKMQLLATQHNGKCLSNKYINCKTRLTWKCEKGHMWNAIPSAIRLGQWCPDCNSYRSELLCKEYLTKKTGYLFIRCKPKWLNGLYLDGYCKELSLAFEYNGLQHYEYVPFFHKCKRKFNDAQKRDNIKAKLCQTKNIKLKSRFIELDKLLEMYKNEK